MVHMKNGREVYPSSIGLESFKVTMGTEIGVDEYSSSETYAVGDYCIYTNTIYKCKTAITTPEAFNSSKWDATSIEKELKSIKSSLSDLDKRVDASSANQTIDITGYTDSNMYTFPSDGYICLNGGSANSGYIRACLQMGNQRVFHYMNVTNSYTIFTIYVKKGIKYFTAGNSVSGGTVKFTPLISQS